MTRLQRRQRLLTAVVYAFAVLTAVGLVALYPYGGPAEGLPDPTVDSGFTEERFGAVITAIREVEGAAPEFLLPGAVEISVDVRLDDGRDLTIEMVDETGLFRAGQAVEVAQISAPGSPPLFQIIDLPRGTPLAWLAVLFVIAVLLLGRWQGLRALVGLSLSAVIIVGVLVPALLAGRDPTLMAVVASLAVIFATLPLSHGWSMTTRAAIAGTAVALLVTIGLALLAVQLTNLTGLSSEDVQLVRFATGRVVDVRGLLLAGIIVGTLGVLDDVTVSQASTVAALRRADPSADDRAVFGAALRVGRDHIAATVNTLFLAYAGAALPLLILFSVGGAPVVETLTSELVAQEVVRTLVGSIGLILAVPLTTAVAVVVTDATAPLPHVHGSAAEIHASHHPGPIQGTAGPAAPAEPEAPSGAVAPPRPAEAADEPTEDRDEPTPPEAIGPDEHPPPAPREASEAGQWEESLRRSYGLSAQPDRGSGGDGGSSSGGREGPAQVDGG